MEIVVQEGIEELVVIEELLEDPELTELEKCDALAPLYHVEGTGLHIVGDPLSEVTYYSSSK